MLLIVFSTAFVFCHIMTIYGDLMLFDTHYETFDFNRIFTIRYDKEFNVDSKAEYSALSSTRSQKKKLKQTMPVPL